MPLKSNCYSNIKKLLTEKRISIAQNSTFNILYKTGNMRIMSFCLILFLGFQLQSCKKVEGKGGAATIKGSILGKKYNSVGNLIAEYPLAKHDLFIIYGQNSTYFDDKIETSFDGSFEFRNLQPGTYTIYTIGKDPTVSSGDKTISQTITIAKKDKKSVIDLGIIEVRD